MDGDAQPHTIPKGGAADARSGDAKDDCSSVDVEANHRKPQPWLVPLKSICSTSVLVVLMILGILINCTSLVIGLNSINDCPAQDAIPVYLISSGMSGLVKIPFFAYLHMKTRDTASKKNKVLKRTYHLLIAVGVGLFVMGSFAVYQEFPSFQPGDDNYCDKICYYYAFWFISCIYIFSFLAISILITAMLSGLLVFCLGCAIRSITQERDQE